MYDSNGPHQSPQQTPSPANLNSNDRDGLTRHKVLRLIEAAFLLLMLAMLALSLAGCGTLSTPPSVLPEIPTIPPTTLSERSVSFSEAARLNISSWQKRLTELLPK